MKTTTLSAGVALLCSLLLCNSAMAYDPKPGHLRLTELSYQKLAQCRGKVVTPARLQRLQDGNLAMDEGAAKLPSSLYDNPWSDQLFPAYRRVGNWHFYHPDKTDKETVQPGLVNMSQQRLWARAQLGLTMANDSAQRDYFVGALLHLLQDVSVPAHVTPVYHGPSLVGLFPLFTTKLTHYLKGERRAKFYGIKDPIDSSPVTIELEDLPCPTTDSKLNYDAIRELLARQTLAAMAEPIPNCGNNHWQLFWNKELPHNYFKGYNLELPPFGSNGDLVVGMQTQCEFKAKGNQLQDQRYYEFIQQRHIQAVLAGMLLLQQADSTVGEQQGTDLLQVSADPGAVNRAPGADMVVP